MCGIVASFGGKPIDDVLKGYESQKGRGTDGYGFLALKDGKLIAFRRRTHERGIREELEKVRRLEPDAILFHHRYPTSTPNLVDAAHPLPVTMPSWKHTYYMIHNGVVSGTSQFSENEIEKEGYTFRSEVQEVKYYRAGGKLYERIEDSSINDSEVLGYYVASYLEGERKVIPVTGAIAALVVKVHKKTKKATVYAMRNHMNPLKVLRSKPDDLTGEGDYTLLVSSENKGENLDAHQLHELDLHTLAFKDPVPCDVGVNYALSAGAYSHMGYHFADDDSLVAGYPIVKSPILPGTKEGNDSTDALIAQEIEKRTNDADKAYADYQEALDTFGDDDTPEAQMYIAEYEKKWEEAEELRAEITEGESEIVVDSTGKFQNVPMF